jgi:hypothetical protein
VSVVGFDRPGKPSYCRLRCEKCTLVAKRQGAAFETSSLWIGKGMQRFLVDTSRMMPRDHRQHTRTAPTCWRRLACELVLARLLGTRNPELLHAERKGRTFHAEPSGRATKSAEDPMRLTCRLSRCGRRSFGSARNPAGSRGPRVTGRVA